MIRTLKTLLVAFVALLCLLYAAQNLVNLQAAYGFVAAVLSMSDHVAYPDHIGPAIESLALTWIVLFTIVALEILAGLLAARGALDMWKTRRGDAVRFNRSKQYALAGCGMGLVVWFGLFSVIGGAYFQMWQTELGGASLNGAFQFAVLIGIVMLFVNSPDS